MTQDACDHNVKTQKEDQLFGLLEKLKKYPKILEDNKVASQLIHFFKTLIYWLKKLFSIMKT